MPDGLPTPPVPIRPALNDRTRRSLEECLYPAVERSRVETVRRVVIVDRAVGAMLGLPYADRQEAVGNVCERGGYDGARGPLGVRLDEHDLRSPDRHA